MRDFISVQLTYSSVDQQLHHVLQSDKIWSNLIKYDQIWSYMISVWSYYDHILIICIWSEYDPRMIIICDHDMIMYWSYTYDQHLIGIWSHVDQIRSDLFRFDQIWSGLVLVCYIILRVILSLLQAPEGRILIEINMLILICICIT